MDTLLVEKQTTNIQEEFLPLNGTDFIELYVGNAKQSAHFIKRHLDFNHLLIPD
jgi:4-hydroxyphenylpyruvate dioxygenase